MNGTINLVIIIIIIIIFSQESTGYCALVCVHLQRTFTIAIHFESGSWAFDILIYLLGRAFRFYQYT